MAGSLQDFTKRMAKIYGVPFLPAQIGAESGYNPNAVSPAGAIGAAQIMPGTAAAWGVDPHDPFASIRAAAKHMHEYLKQFGSPEAALTAYNAGPGAVGKPLPAETKAYIQKVLGHGGGDGASIASYMPVASTTGTQGPTELSKMMDTFQRMNDAIYQAPKPLTSSPGTQPQSLLARLSQENQNLLNQNFTTLRGLMNPSQSSPTGSPTTAFDTVASTGPETTADGTVDFEGTKVAAWIAPELKWARAHGWTGKVSSGFRSFQEQTDIYNSGVRPAAKPGTSNHEGTEFPRGAVDVTNAQQLADILRRKPGGSALSWAGAKDPVHFSHPHNGSY